MSENTDSGAVTFVIDTLPRDEEELARARDVMSEVVTGLKRAGVRLNEDLGLGLAVDDARAAILDRFHKPSEAPDKHRLVGGPGDGAPYESAPEVSRVGDEFEIRGETRGAIYRVSDDGTARHVGWMNDEDVRYLEGCEPTPGTRAIGVDRPDLAEDPTGVLNVAENHAFHVVTDPGRRFLSKAWVDERDCEHLVAREVVAADAPSTRVIYLDPRITAEAVQAIVHKAGSADRFFLTIHSNDDGVLHVWHENDVEIERELTELIEVTDEVWRRVAHIREAVRA